MANSFKTFFSKVAGKDEEQVSLPNREQEMQIDDLKNMEIDLENNNDNMNIDEINKKQNHQAKQLGKVETVILDFDDIENEVADKKSKQSFETVNDEEKDSPVSVSKKISFLVVDDANFMRILLRKILEEEGFEVVGEATNGQEAINMVSKLSPDIVTMDITMPEMDGITALREILAMNSSVKVIMCSAINQREMVLEALKIGAKDFISKPFEQNKVADVIKRVVSMK